MPVATQHTLEEQEARAKAEGWGWTGDMRTETEVLELLFALVRVNKPDVCVETGTYFGHGAEAISTALKDNGRGHLWTVEREPLEYAENERITYVNADSIEWSAKDAPAQINFALVDCCEEAAGRIEVFRNLWPRMVPGGAICAHDATFYAPDYLGGLCEVAGPPNVIWSALNGLAMWVKP